MMTATWFKRADDFDDMLLRVVRVLPKQRARAMERWLMGREEARKLRAADGVLVSWAKSGRTWLRAMLARYYEQEYKLSPVGLLDFDNLHRQNPCVPIVFFTHGNYLRDFTKNYESKADFYDKKMLLLARDPRDIAVSQYFQWKYRMPAWKQQLNFASHAADASLFEFVMANHGLRQIIDYLNGWAKEAARIRQFRLIRYEEMRRDPTRVLTDVLHFLGTPATPPSVADAVEFTRFENLRRLEAERAFRGSRLAPADPNNPDSFKVRRGKIAGYRDYFDADQLAAIDRLTVAALSPFYGYPASYASEAATER
jgi:sulfotransferase family protein